VRCCVVPCDSVNWASTLGSKLLKELMILPKLQELLHGDFLRCQSEATTDHLPTTPPPFTHPELASIRKNHHRLPLLIDVPLPLPLYLARCQLLVDPFQLVLHLPLP